jgi:murein DD-endopeptidase
MRRLPRILLVIGSAFLITLTGLSHTSAQKPSAVPVDLEIPAPPNPVKANGKIHLLYELHVTNFGARSLELTRVEVLRGGAGNPPLAGYEGVELTGRLARPGAPADLSDKRVIAAGMRAVVFLEITAETRARLPHTLLHRLFFKPGTPGENTGAVYVEGASTTVRRDPALVIGPPLRGGGWVALSGMSNTSLHRRTLVVVDGKARIAQRFATDWTRVGADGLAFRGDPAKNTNWSAYGAEVLAVADATVADVKDGVPENDPASEKKAVPINLETVGVIAGCHVPPSPGTHLGRFFSYEE